MLLFVRCACVVSHLCIRSNMKVCSVPGSQRATSLNLRSGLVEISPRCRPWWIHLNGSSLQAHEICCTHQAHVGPLLPPPLRAARSSAQALVCYPLDFRSPPRIGSVAPIAMLCTALPALVGLMLFGWHAPSRGGVKHAPLGVVPSFGVLPQYFDCLASCRNCREREREREADTGCAASCAQPCTQSGPV